jgi:hypothetical protein
VVNVLARVLLTVIEVYVPIDDQYLERGVAWSDAISAATDLPAPG